ncbi:M20 family metallo-hydrolase [Sporosarcina luteola]|uniref:M20 family metallo-hydrolase n=1 Tax=Sporosarcina luteola TaxID=582850 RepID=UPI00203AF4F4|nr:M20 family metallo-hydrolase [Sporosarcina luteola]MCM3711538.1 M20 family metallo-hydrolase [Sporosarcina luteola]
MVNTSLQKLTINQKRLQENMDQLAEIGKFGETGVCRLALSKEYKEGIELVKRWMEEAGLQTKVDNFGNLVGRLEGKNPDAPILMLGSHIDSQPSGGRFDGPIGVLGGLEVVQTMQEQNITPEMPIEIMAFCDEEGFRFNKGLFGSRGITGQLDEGELDRSDKDGVTRREALLEFGADPDQLTASEYPKGSIDTYIEMHIEQGPVLEEVNAPVGIVTGISGPLWLTIELTGSAGHAGTVPMKLRKDALVGAAEIISGLKEIVTQDPDAPTVGTVGNLTISPNARAIVPAKVTFTIDLRDINLDRRNRYEAQLRGHIEKTAEENGLQYTISEDTNIFPEPCSEDILDVMREESKAMGLEVVPELISGAFHDALSMAQDCKIAMIFVRSKDGVSHDPAEFSTYEDIAVGTELLYKTAVKIATK